MLSPTVIPLSLKEYEEAKDEVHRKWRLEYEQHRMLAFLRGPYG